MAFDPQDKWSVLCRGKVSDGMRQLAHEAVLSVDELMDLSWQEFVDRLKAVRHEGLALKEKK